MSDTKYVLGAMRVPFLFLALACAFLGLATAMWTGAEVRALDAILVFVGAVAAHIGVNSLNEYFDLKSGLDLRTQKTPFSGGDPLLASAPEKAGVALWTGLVAVVVTIAIGVYFLLSVGMALLPLGLLGILLIVTYTVWLTRSALACLIAPGLGFGTCVVMGTDLVLSGGYSWPAFFASLVPFFLVNNLLLFNQFPDVEADRTVGRKHLPIQAGRRASAVVYGLFLLLSYVSIGVGVAMNYLPLWSLLGLGTLVLAVPAARGAYRHADEPEKLVPFLGQNVIINLATPVLMGIGLLLA